MPVDKFGRHMLVHPNRDLVGITQQQQQDQKQNLLSSFYLCQPSTLYSNCVLNIKGTRNKNNEFIMEDGNNYYKIPVSGKIQDIVTVPVGLDVGFKIGDSLQGGNKFSFKNGIKEKIIHITIVLLCPIVQDE